MTTKNDEKTYIDQIAKDATESLQTIICDDFSSSNATLVKKSGNEIRSVVNVMHDVIDWLEINNEEPDTKNNNKLEKAGQNLVNIQAEFEKVSKKTVEDAMKAGASHGVIERVQNIMTQFLIAVTKLCDSLVKSIKNITLAAKVAEKAPQRPLTEADNYKENSNLAKEYTQKYKQQHFSEELLNQHEVKGPGQK